MGKLRSVRTGRPLVRSWWRGRKWQWGIYGVALVAAATRARIRVVAQDRKTRRASRKAVFSISPPLKIASR
jgi:hypothetical protein